MSDFLSQQKMKKFTSCFLDSETFVNMGKLCIEEPNESVYKYEVFFFVFFLQENQVLVGQLYTSTSRSI